MSSFEPNTIKYDVLNDRHNIDTRQEHDFSCYMIKNEEVDIKCQGEDEEYSSEGSLTLQDAKIFETNDGQFETGDDDHPDNSKENVLRLNRNAEVDKQPAESKDTFLDSLTLQDAKIFETNGGQFETGDDDHPDNSKENVLRLNRNAEVDKRQAESKDTSQDSFSTKLSLKYEKKRTEKNEEIRSKRNRRIGPQEHCCTFCGYQTLRIYEFKRHMMRHSNPELLEKYSCPKCTFQTIWKQKFQLHVSRHDGFKTQTKRCKKCYYETARKDGLRGHVCSNEVLTCHECGYKTLIKRLLRRHIQSHRKLIQFPFNCSICSFGSKYKSHLKTHMNRHKTEEAKIFRCIQCSYKTCQKGNLKRHTAVMHGGDGVSYKCFHCRYESLDKYALKSHVLRHNKQNYEKAKTQKCFQCDFKSVHKNSLKWHLLKHKKPDELDFIQCTKCDYKTYRKTNLTRHIRVQHS